MGTQEFVVKYERSPLGRFRRSESLESRWGRAKLQEALERYENGESINKLARVYGCSNWTLGDVFKRNGIKIHARQYYQIKRVSRIRRVDDVAVKAYVAGLLDGEGSITFNSVPRKGNRIKGYPKLSIFNTCVQALDFIAKNFGGRVTGCRPNPTRFSTKPIWQWQLGSFIDVLSFLEQVEPYLIIKKEKAKQTISWLRDRVQTIRLS